MSSITCERLLLWNRQKEFSAKVEKYLILLQNGSVGCDDLDCLKQEMRILKISNCSEPKLNKIMTDETEKLTTWGSFKTLTY